MPLFIIVALIALRIYKSSLLLKALRHSIKWRYILNYYKSG
jgi:hypothetical protein